MTPQEQQLLMQLTQRINQTQLQEKDPDAENLLGHELGASPDALYIMAQTVLVQNMALEQLKTQVAQLQQQLQQARQQPQQVHTTSFLGRLLGERDQAQAPPPPPYQPPQPQQGWQPVPQYQQAPPVQYAAPQYAAPQYVAAPAAQPSFLRGAMQTAAVVAAGALAFEGVESLMHGFGHGSGWGSGFGMGPGAGFGGGFGGGFERPVEETVINNNYYDEPAAMGGGEHRIDHNFGQNFAPDFGGGEHQPEGGSPHFRDTGDGSGAVYSDASYNTSGANDSAGAFDQGAYDNEMDNDTVAADNSVDDVQIDDSGNGFDDDGGGDGSGDGF